MLQEIYKTATDVIHTVRQQSSTLVTGWVPDSTPTYLSVNIWIWGTGCYHIPLSQRKKIYHLGPSRLLLGSKRMMIIRTEMEPLISDFRQDASYPKAFQCQSLDDSLHKADANSLSLIPISSTSQTLQHRKTVKKLMGLPSQLLQCLSHCYCIY